MKAVAKAAIPTKIASNEPAVANSRLRNRGFFDDEGSALPVINVFDRWTRK